MDGLSDSERIYAWNSCWEKSLVGMAIVREDGRFVSVNQQWLKILGVSASEFYGSNFQNITDHKDLKEDMEQAKLVSQGKIDSYEMDKSYCFGSGKTVSVRLLVTRIPMETDRPFIYYLSRIVTIHPVKKKSLLNTIPLKELGECLDFIQKHWKWIAAGSAAAVGAVKSL